MSNKRFSGARVAAALMMLGGSFGAVADAPDDAMEMTALQLKLSDKVPDPGIADPVPPSIQAAPNAVNYAFSTATDGSLADMSSGTTVRLAGDQDDNASTVAPIGFDFYFQGVRYDRYSVNSNGTLRLGATAISNTLYDPLAQAGQALITAYGADQRSHATGKIHAKVTGAAPDRVLVVEWQNMQADYNTGGAANLTYQVHLHETTGVVEFVYGAMRMSAAGAADANSSSPQIGFSSGTAAGAIGAITAPASGAPTFNGAATAPVNNTYGSGDIAALNSAADGARRRFTLTPQAAIAPGGPMTFTGVSATAMTLNWTDAANETGYAVYVSTDGTNYTFASALGENAVSYGATGLIGSTTYAWRVYAVTEGSTALLAGSQATSAPVPATSQASGAWSDPATWSTNAVPTASDAVTIAAGTTVTIDSAASAYSLAVAGTLQFEQTTARTLNVAMDTVVTSGGTLQSNPAGTQSGHVLSVGGSLTNDGTLDFSTNADTAGAGITFTGAANTTFGGTGATNDVRTVTVNKGTSFASTVELNPTAFTVRGVTTDGAGWLTLTNGTLKLSGTFAGTNRVHAASPYTIPATAGLWLNNPNYTVAAQNGNATNTGLLRITQGTYNQGTLASATMGGSSGAVFTIEGGTVNLAGRFNPTGFTTYNQSGGVLNVATVGNSGSGTANGSFTLTASATFNMTGGTINLVQPSTGATPIDFINSAQIVAANGTLNVGTAATASGFNFRLRGNLPNLVVDNTTSTKTATATAQVNLLGTTWIKSGAALVVNGQICLVTGPTFTNDGTLTGTAANTRFYFLGGSGPTTYAGSGTVTAPLLQFEVDNAAGVTIDPSVAPIVVGRFNNFSGGVTGAGKLTIGNGGATTAVVQFGVTGVSQPVLGFDVTPVFNPGTGGVNLIYGPELTGRTMGHEVPPSRTLNLLSISNPNAITIAGGDVTVTGTGAGAIALGTAPLITGAHTLHLDSATGTVTRTTGYVQGTLKKNFPAAMGQVFELGSANGYAPVIVDATAGTFPASMSVTSIETAAPAIQPSGKALARHWRVDANDVTASVVLSYLDGDVPATASEADLRIHRHAAPGPANYAALAGTLDAAANTATLSNATTFGTLTLAEYGSDLAIDVTGPATATPGGTATYTITATNHGTGEHAFATVTDAFPAGMTCATTCAGTQGSTCAAGTIAGDVNDTARITVGGSVVYTAQCAIAASASGTLTQNAAIDGGSVPDANAANDAASFGTALQATADLSIAKTDGTTSAIAGRTVTYTITASNAGPSQVLGATVADAFPSTQTCTWTCSGAGGACAASGSGAINDTVDLPAGTSVTYTATCAIAPSATGTLVNVASITAPNGVADPSLINNEATDDDTVIAGEADLSIAKTDGVTSAIAGGTVTYTIAAGNAGPSDVLDAVVTDAFPSTQTCTWTCAAAGNASCTASGSGALSDTIDLPVGGTATYTATCAIASDATGTLSNTASIAAPNGVTDPSLSNNDATDGDTVLTAEADLSITKTDGMPTAAAGGDTIYTIVASNAGPSDVLDAIVTDAFPSTQTCTWTCSGANGGLCAPSGSGDITDQADLPAGGSVTYVADCAIAASATGSLSNTATIAVPAGVDDKLLVNNSATDVDTLGVEADLSITNDDGVTTATAGNTVTYTLVARNAGPADAIGATVADAFPSNATCTWTCGGANGGTCTASGNGPIADTANLPSGASVTYVASCAIAASATGSLVNLATVTAPAGVGDPSPSNNTATDTDTLTGEADLSIATTDGVASAVAGGTVTYTITAGNAGPSAVTGATVTGTMPASATCTWTCAGTHGASCTASGSGGIGDAVDLPVGGTAVYTASCAIAGTATGTLVNAVSIAPPNGIADPAAGNNTASDTDTLTSSANASITVTDGAASVAPGGKVTYTIVASNAGPSALMPANVTAAFPPSLTDCAWTCTANVGGTCEKAGGIGALTDAPQLAAGGSVTYSATCSVPDGMSEGTVLSNVATISTGAVSDPNTADNSATDQTTIEAAGAPLGANVGGTMRVGGTFTRGSQVTYTVVLTNTGAGAQADNTGDEFTDTLPAGLTLVSATATSGTASTGAGIARWNGSLAANGTVTITITATIDAGASGVLMNQGTIRYDSNGDGTNDATAMTDDPNQAGSGNATGFGVSVPAVMVPTLDRVSLLLMLLCVIGIVWHGRRHAVR